MGGFKEVDLGDRNDCVGSYIRVRVTVDTNIPLRRGIRVKIGDGEELVDVFFRYERLENFCYECGLVGHLVRDCPSKKLNQGGAADLKYGHWMKADKPSGSKTRGRERKPHFETKTTPNNQDGEAEDVSGSEQGDSNHNTEVPDHGSHEGSDTTATRTKALMVQKKQSSSNLLVKARGDVEDSGVAMGASAGETINDQSLIKKDPAGLPATTQPVSRAGNQLTPKKGNRRKKMRNNDWKRAAREAGGREPMDVTVSMLGKRKGEEEGEVSCDTKKQKIDQPAIALSVEADSQPRRAQ